jgi:hypothetical protein
MGDLEGGIRRALVQEDRLTRDWKSDGQIQALAIFIRAIKLGNAELLFTLFEQNTKFTDKQLIEVLTKLNKGLEKVFSVPNN